MLAAEQGDSGWQTSEQAETLQGHQAAAIAIASAWQEEKNWRSHTLNAGCWGGQVCVCSCRL
jgi:hypothetical protein